ncbi:MAG: acireductone synthase, partial [candidate division Zixibacteria bacterium]|nr:acireductone synthase [candidate division Zixibacteria bacterium]
LRGELFPDVPVALKQWKNAGKRIYIYSSGSVQAQRLIFRYSDHGDLTGLIDGYFDTETGAKRDAASYGAIVSRVGLAASGCLFISDITAELEAASSAGFHVLQALRPGNPEQAGGYPVIRSFADLSRPVSELAGSGREGAR